MLYLAAQLVFVVLFAIKHQAQAIIAAMAVQIYVCSFITPEVKNDCDNPIHARVSHQYSSSSALLLACQIRRPKSFTVRPDRLRSTRPCKCASVSAQPRARMVASAWPLNSPCLRPKPSPMVRVRAHVSAPSRVPPLHDSVAVIQVVDS
jgi:hypothetical protein